MQSIPCNPLRFGPSCIRRYATRSLQHALRYIPITSPSHSATALTPSPSLLSPRNIFYGNYSVGRGHPLSHPSAQSIHPTQVTAHLLLPPVHRLDGRPLTAIRPTSLEFADIRTADGSAICSIGPTTVLCTCTLLVSTPLITLPHSGFLVVEFHFNPLTSPPSSSPSSTSLFTYGRPTPLASALSLHLQTLLISHCLPLTSLSILPSTHCWTLHIDLVPLSLTSPSSLYDAATLAAVTALTSLTIPPTQVTEEGEVVVVRGVGRGVEVRGLMVGVSFVLVDGMLLMDVDGEEEEWSEAVVRVTVGEEGRVLDVWKAGGVGLEKNEIEECIRRAKERSAEAIPFIRSAAKGKAVGKDG